MKKYILFAVCATMLAFTSCSDSEEIEIYETGAIAFDINTGSIYEEFGITQSIKDQMLRDKVYAIGVTSLIYNENGVLVDSMTTYSYNVNNTRQSYESLVNGEYTAIFVQTLVRVNKDFMPDFYRLVGVENISTLEIKQLAAPLWYAVIGTATEKFTLKDKMIEIKPDALGSIIDCNFFDFEESPCVKVGAGTNEMCSAYKLDPGIPEEDRYLRELSTSEKFDLLCNVSVEESQERVTIYVLGNTLKYRFYFQTEENAGTNSWFYLPQYRTVDLTTGERTYMGYAYLNDDNGTVDSYYGDYNGMAEWYTKLGKLEPTGELVPELYMKWGSSVSSVQASMTDYEMIVGSSGNAVKQGDASYLVSYNGKGKESQIFYYFKTATTGLFEADVQYPKDNVSSEDILNYLNNNYIFIVSENGTHMYASKDYTTVILFFEINGVWNVGFVDFEYIKNNSSKVAVPHYILPRITSCNNNRGASNLDGIAGNVSIVKEVEELRSAINIK